MRYVWIFIAALAAGTVLFQTFAHADPRTDCPDANPCKIVAITAQEEKILLDERGILATAGQARSLDLGGLVVFFQQKIARAPAGDVPKAEPKPATGGPGIDLAPPGVKPN